MNHKVSLVSALCLSISAAISWAAWSSFVTAQDATAPSLRNATPPPVASAPLSIPIVDPHQTPSKLSQYQPIAATDAPIVLPAGGPQYSATTSEYHDPQPLLPGYSGRDSLTGETVTAIIEYQRLQNEINGLLERRRDAKDHSEWSSLRRRLVEATAAQFDLRQKVREHEVEELKRRLAAVETTVANRNKLKDEIVEKRVVDILREPDQLQWEPLEIATAPNGIPILPTPLRLGPPVAAPNTPGTILAGPVDETNGKVRVPRTITKYQAETVIDEDGNEKKVFRPIQETVYEEVDGQPAIVPNPNLTPSSVVPQDERRDARTPFGNHEQFAPTRLTVAEAEAKVRIAAAKRDAIRGRNHNGAELKAQQLEFELAELVLARARAESVARLKLLELDVRQAEASYKQATAILTEDMSVNRRAPNSIPETQLAAHRASVEQAQIRLERAKVMLELHRKSHPPEAELPGPPRNDK